MTDASDPQDPPQPGFQIKLFADSAEVKKKYLCAFCQLILRNPTQVFCGHRFCKECLQHCFSNKLICPECKRDSGEDCDQLLDQGFQDNALKREMIPIKSKCYFEGCPWTGSFKEFETDHYATCKFRPRECPRCHLTLHRRQSTDNSPRSGQPPDDHVTCLFEEIDRINEVIGVSQDNRPSGSLRPVLERLSVTERVLEEIKGRLKDVVPTSESKIPEKAENRNGSKYTPDSVSADKMTVIENVLVVLNRELEGFTVGLRNQEKQRQQEKNLTEHWMKTMERTIQIKDATIAEQERRIMELEQTTYDGTLLWKIPDFRRKREDAISGRTTSLYSPPFYTSKTGYKMCVRLFLNGDGMGKGKHVSLFFVLMRGQYDALLSWPFRQKVTLMLLDQNNHSHVMDTFRTDPTSNSFKRPTSEMNIASGCPLFLPVTQLDNPSCAYVKDNTAFVKVTVSQE